MTKPKAVYKDWRGVPIEVGQIVVYYGQNMGNAVGIVDSFTSGGNVRLKMIHRNNASGGAEKHSVPPARCTVVLALPDTDLRTVHEVNEEARIKKEKADATEATHTFAPHPGKVPKIQNYPLPPGQKGKLIRRASSFNNWQDQYSTYDEDAYTAAYRAWSKARDASEYGPCTACGTSRHGVYDHKSGKSLPGCRDITCNEVLAARRI